MIYLLLIYDFLNKAPGKISKPTPANSKRGRPSLKNKIMDQRIEDQLEAHN